MALPDKPIIITEAPSLVKRPRSFKANGHMPAHTIELANQIPVRNMYRQNPIAILKKGRQYKKENKNSILVEHNIKIGLNI